MTEHLTFEQLCDLHDGQLDAAANEGAHDHVASCADCTAQLASLALLAEHTSALPSEMAPPEDLWGDIKADLAPRHAARTSGFGGLNLRQLAAAAVLVAIGSSALTVATMRRSQPTQPQAISNVAAAGRPSALPASLASEESGFTRSVDVLQRTLDDRRASLAPSTVETVERSLRVADSAIVEAREALAHDPSNRALAKLFASNYERKIDLLRRATELAPRT